jgi:hypothetical protein
VIVDPETRRDLLSRLTELLASDPARQRPRPPSAQQTTRHTTLLAN